LGDAVVRLYERYAELLPDGPERTRAAATARSFSGIAAFEVGRWAAAVAPAIEVVDHRTLGYLVRAWAKAFWRTPGPARLADDAPRATTMSSP